MLAGILLRHRRIVVVCVLSGALAIGVSACGSSSSGSSSTGVAGGTSTTSSTARYEARLNYAKCMRSHGVNLPDPSANGGPAAGANGAGPGAGGFRALRANPNFTSANQACAKYRSRAFAFANLNPAQRDQLDQDLVRFAECMRAHNINVPDPSSSGGGPFQIFRSIPSSERNSPAFSSAIKACSSNIPFRRGGAGGPPGGGAGGPPGA